MKQLGAILFVILLCGCVKKEFSSPRATFETMANAAKSDDADKFLECYDLESIRPVGISDQDWIRLKKNVLTSSNFREALISSMKEIKELVNKGEVSVRSEIDLGKDTKGLILPNNTSLFRSEDTLIYVKCSDGWKYKVGQ